MDHLSQKQFWTTLMDKIPSFDYLKGEAFTDKLKEVTGCKTLLEMSERFDVPKATFSAWNTHERTSHELMVRLHLALGIPIEELALPKNEYEKAIANRESLVNGDVQSGKTGHLLNAITSPKNSVNPQHETIVLKSFCLSNGKLLDTGEIPYAARIFNSWNLDRKNTIEIETNEGRFLLDKTQNDAVSGEYLIDMNGRMSINYIQRLPNKLAVAFGNTTLEVADGDINVVGRVAVEMKNK
jgi:hypothetical protein